MNIRKRLTAGAMTVAVFGIGFMTPTTASAAPSPGTCTGEVVCLYFNSNYAGATFGDDHGAAGSPENYGSPNWYVFSGGNGAGYYVKNNAASVFNFDLDYPAEIYYGSNNTGPKQFFQTYTGGNLNSSLKNNNASQCMDINVACP